MQSLVDTMRSETPDPSSIAAHLLDIKDPSTGASKSQTAHWVGLPVQCKHEVSAYSFRDH